MTFALDMAHKGHNLARSGGARGRDIAPVRGSLAVTGATATSQLASAYSLLISAARIPMPLSTMSSSWANDIRKHSSR